MSNFGIIQWSPGITLEEVERLIIIKAYEFYGRNKTATANALNISVRTLDTKLEKYDEDERTRVETERAERVKDANFLERQRGFTIGPDGRQMLYGAPTGVHMEPAPQPPAQQAMPVQERQKVQSVLPGKADSSGSKRASR